jgi:ATP-dependent HslUV protease subunit HslV
MHPLGFSSAAGWGDMKATTILAVRKNGRVVRVLPVFCMPLLSRRGRARLPRPPPHTHTPAPALPSQAVIGDGQVTRGDTVVKGNAVKVRRIGAGEVVSGFAGSTADCLTLRERLETKLEEHPGQLTRACVELAKEWRMEKWLKRLEAVMLVVDKDVSLTVTGNGDVLEPEDGIIAIGSGGSYALAAARALLDSEHDALAIAERAMRIAAGMCVYTNTSFVVDAIPALTAEERARFNMPPEEGKKVF